MTKKSDGPFYCLLSGCEYAGTPYSTRGALGSHRRKHHGIVALAQKIKRPAGGTLWCPVEGCPVGEHGSAPHPYVTQGGLGLHKRNVHGIPSADHGSIAKRDRRARYREIPSPLPDTNAPLPVPREWAALLDAPRRPLDTGQIETFRRRVLWALCYTWPALLDAHPLDLRDALARIMVSNLAPARRRTRSAAADL